MEPKDKIRIKRRKQKLTQKQLAELTGLTQATITKIETGATLYPNIDVAFKIARALKEDVYTLFGDHTKRNPLPESTQFEFDRIKSAKVAILIHLIQSELSQVTLLNDLSKHERLTEKERLTFRARKENVQDGLFNSIKAYKEARIIENEDIKEVLSSFPGFSLWQNFIAPLKDLISD